MKRTLGFLLFILFLTGSRTSAQIEDYYYKNPQTMSSLQQQSLSSSISTVPTPVHDTVNMAIILCVEKGQPRDFSIPFFVDQLKQNIPDYFAKATCNNFTINRLDVLVDSTDAPKNKVYAFELPGYLTKDPLTSDTDYVCSPWMVRNILARADKKYNFTDYDYNNDGTVDMVDFVVIRHTAKSNGGTVGLSSVSTYTTNDPYQSGGYIKIDGSQTRDSNGLLHAIIRKYSDEDFDSQITHIVHELGHAFFDFPDYDHAGYSLYPSYVFGQFCVMSGGGFKKVASPYNPLLRAKKGWTTITPITLSQTVSFNNIESSSPTVYWYSSTFNSYMWGNWAVTYHELAPTVNNRWIKYWPIPRSASDDTKRGVMIWDLGTSIPGETEFGDIEAAHGLWDWVTKYLDVCNYSGGIPKKPLRSNVQNPLAGYDSLDVRNSYVWEVLNPKSGIYDSLDGVYKEDLRIGSETCFYDPIHPKKFSFYTNPNSCSKYIDTYSRCSGLTIENLRLDNGTVKADFQVGADGFIVNENITLPKGSWQFSKDLVVNPGVTLRIQPGTTIRFTPKTTSPEQNPAPSIIVKGTLIANGTETEKITFDFYGQSAVDHNGINFNYGSSGDSISNAIIKNAYYGIYMNQSHCTIRNNDISNCNIGIYAEDIDNVSGSTLIYHNKAYRCNFASLATYNSSPLVLNNDFRDNSSGYGAYILNSSPGFGDNTTQGNNYIHNNRIGVYAEESIPVLGGSPGNNWPGNNILENNTLYNLDANNNALIWATNNWWGSNLRSSVESTISNDGTCNIYYDPWLQVRPVLSLKMNVANESTDAVTLLKKNSSSATIQSNPVIDKLIKANNSLLNKDFSTAQRLSQEIMENYPDAPHAVNAMNIFRASVRDNNPNLLQPYLTSIVNKRSNSRLAAYADLLLANSDIKQKAKLLNDLAVKYQDNPYLEKILLSEILYYFHEENNYDKAVGILDKLEEKFPKSESAFFAHSLLRPELSTIDVKMDKKSQENLTQEDKPSSFELLGNYPNPSNPATTIKYSLPSDCRVNISIYDILGKEVRSFEITSEAAGNHSITWNGLNSYGEQTTSGIYIYKVRAVSNNDGTVYEKSSKMIMMK